MNPVIIEAVSALFDRFHVSTKHLSDDRRRDLIAGYAEDLDDLPEALVLAAMARLRKTSTFMPSVAEIRRPVVEAAVALPTEEQAWRMVKAALAAHQPGDGRPWGLDPLVMEAVKAVGTHELRHDERGRAADYFRKLYREKREEVITHIQAGAIPLTAIDRPEYMALGQNGVSR